jgi:diguanylate cyclase (GGDEF)-like protein/PAS domain S-box-containing protein
MWLDGARKAQSNVRGDIRRYFSSRSMGNSFVHMTASRDDATISPTMEAGTDPAVYRTLLESTLAIPWKIDWATMTFAYMGPQIEALLGWKQDSWKTVDDWASRMHPDDREKVVDFCVSQSLAGADHEADYRALTADDGFVWIRDVVHVVRKENGEVDSLIGFMFDITERKKTEQQLVEMQKKLEALSFEDGLTHAANRRMFDKHLAIEWDIALRTGQPLSVILLDLDDFKQFNDLYGHLQGDDCLVQIANALKAVGHRPRDIVARYGGEEFVLLLPDTDEAGARRIAEQCQRAIAALAIPHAGSSCGAVITASIGAGAEHPAPGRAPNDLVEAVDKLLYQAKKFGRNRTVAAKVG